MFKSLKKNFLNLNQNIRKFSNYFETQHEKLIKSSEIKFRQKNLVDKILKTESLINKDFLIIIPGSIKTFQTDTVIPNIHYKQNSDFIYFTGTNKIDSANCILVIRAINGELKETNLYHPTITENQSVWEGDGINSSYSKNYINQICDQTFDISKLFYLIETYPKENLIFTTQYLKSLNLLNGYFTSKNFKFDLSYKIDSLRLIKSENELKSLRRTCKLGSDALLKTINWSKNQTLVNENQLASIFDYESRINGATKMSYPAVVGGNERSTIIHYGANSQNLKTNDWVLMDAGCEDIDGYCSDITRSWLIGNDYKKNNIKSNLHFSLNQALCELQKKLIDSITVDQTTLNSLFNDMCKGLHFILQEFGIIEKNLFNQRNSFDLVYTYCPHHVSHFLGLDVHDCKTISRDVPLSCGMCFTIEPGLYFRQNSNVKEEFKGIGIRIEDDLIINEKNEIENLTNSCPLI